MSMGPLSMMSTVLNSVNNVQKRTNDIQTQLTSGKRTMDPAEQGSVTRLSTQISSYGAASGNISKASSINKVAQTGLSAIADVLSQMQTLAAKTNDNTMSSADKDKLNQTFQSLMKQVDSLSKNATVDGVGLLGASATDMKVQSGINSSDQTTVNAVKSDTTTLGVAALNISSTGDSSAAMDALKTAIDSVSSSQSSLSAAQVGLDATQENITSVTDNLQNTIDKIQKPDMAKLQTQLAELTIQQQVNYFLINSVNQSAQSVLSLFR